MTRVGFSGKAAVVAAFLMIGASVAACVSDSGTASAGTSSGTTTGTINRADGIQINGSPATTATVGRAYSFKPAVSNTPATSGTAPTLKFSIENTPAWARFNPSTGSLTGTPNATQVGRYANITISVSSGTTMATLPAFTIVVREGNPQSNVTLSWEAPTENADGSPLTDLRGFKVHYGRASRHYSQTIQVPNGGLMTYVVQNLPAGKYYFAVSAYNSLGHESLLSREVSAQVD